MNGPPPQREQPKRRPRNHGELGFQPRRAVRWYNPAVLADSGLRVITSQVFGAFLDKRELQDALDPAIFDQHATKDEVWIDYIADTGDGFSPTYTTAWLAAQPELQPEGSDSVLPRGDVCILGGDEVYPVANADAYADRLMGPFEAALPWTADGGQDIFAIPGNHDWYDGLTSFMRVFCQHKWIGGRCTRQARSYFALRMPHRWWLWGIDIAFDAFVDEPQLRYFGDVVRDHMRPGDRVILCTAKPSWVKPHDPGSYRNLAYVERKLLAEFDVPLTLAGDYHHYSRYVGPDGCQKVTAGGGGAFLHPTHGLPRALVLPAVGDDDAAVRVAGPRGASDPSEPASPVDPAAGGTGRIFHQARAYPDVATSRRLLWRCLAMPLYNPSFVWLPAGLSAVLLWAAVFTLRATDPTTSLAETARTASIGELAGGLLASPVALLTLFALTGGLIGFARPSVRWPHPRRLPWLPKCVLGTTHAAAQLLAFLAVSWAVTRALAPLLAGGWPFVVLLAGVAVVGGAAGGLVMGAYLGIVNTLPGHAHGNEAFSALRLEDHKNFVRLHIDRHGALHLYAIGVDEVCRKWDADPENADPEAPWLRPRGPAPRTRLVDGPVQVSPREPADG